jgi:hypothetical protein
MYRCGVTVAGAGICFGTNTFGQSTVPATATNLVQVISHSHSIDDESI